ncbi:MFS transporter [Undibacterium sp. TC9W]|uniref:MFS transporter n=1 Tax=Undibacterium sp. TC9W TaxID=3413053 RepID=UPI003BF0D2F0
MTRFPAAVIRLLFSSFVFVMGRAVALPFMALYLYEHLGINQQTIGWVLGGSIFSSTLFSLYAGYLADRLSKNLLMKLAGIVVAVSTAALTIVPNAWTALFALMCIESALTLRGISLKATLAELLPPDQRPKAFSLNYTLINVAFALGPVLGAWLFAIKVSGPLWMAAVFSLLASQVLGKPAAALKSGEASKSSPAGFRATMRVLRSDRRLILFSMGSVLTSFVFGRFVSGYLSQYLMVSQGTQATAQLLPFILITNAVTVVALQYPVGKLMQQKYLFRWVSLGATLYALGLLGFMHAGSAMSWVLATLVFTVGEVIVIPCEYMFIDMIAPADKRGSYYGAQSLAMFGAALNPVICGYLLAHFHSDVMFWVLISATMLGVLMYFAGTRSKPVEEHRAESEAVVKPATEPAKVTCKPRTCLSVLAASKQLAGNRVKNLFPLS